MTDPGPYRMSQGLDVLQPKTGPAYPVPCDEWEFLKGKLRQVSTSPWLYQTAGSLLGGAGITTFVTILTGTLPTPPSNALVIAWAVVAVSIICAAASFFFASQQRKLQSVQVSDVIVQMDLIEQRYDRSGAMPGQSGSPQTILTIISAKYGAATTYSDVTYVLRQRVDGSGLHVVAGNQLAGDPCPGVVKELVIEYELSGQRHSKTVKEDEMLSIP